MKTTIRSLLLLAALSVSVLPGAQAINPPPDGGYPGGNTAEGQNALQSTTSGGFNSAVGYCSLFANSTGSFNTGVGAGALDLNTANNNTAIGAAALLLNTIGSNNTADGTDALVFNNTGTQNTATGAFALYGNTTGGGNIAVGYQAGSSLTTGNNNIEIGNTGVAAESNAIRIGDPAIHTAIFLAGITAMSPAPPNQTVLVDPATGQLGSAAVFGVVITNPENTAVGDQALVSNTGGSNTATGFRALFENIHGGTNTAVGDEALQNNDSSGNAFANANTAVGALALQSNVDGDSNNAVGYQALANNTDGVENNAVGYSALLNSGGAANTAVGDSAFMNSTTGSFNTIIGWQAGTGSGVDGNDNIYVGATSGPAGGAESGSIRIGDPGFITGCWIAGITGQAAPGGAPVLISADGKLGTLLSSARFKEDIKPMDKASESLFSLNPVTFHYKKAIDANGTLQFGLVAEQLVKVNPDLVINGRDGKVNAVRYEAVNAMLLNEFLKEHRVVQEQGTTIARLQKQIESLAVVVQRVSAQLELSKSAPQTVLNNQF